MNEWAPTGETSKYLLPLLGFFKEEESKLKRRNYPKYQ
jgi:hypothetical protein